MGEGQSVEAGAASWKKSVRTVEFSTVAALALAAPYAASSATGPIRKGIASVGKGGGDGGQKVAGGAVCWLTSVRKDSVCK